jgi:hypothetical protein
MYIYILDYSLELAGGPIFPKHAEERLSPSYKINKPK